MNRPLVWVAAAFVAGMYAAAVRVCPGILFPAFLCAVGLALAGAIPSLHISRPASVILMAFGVGALLWNLRHVGPPGDPLSRYIIAHPGIKEWTVEGKVRLADLEQTDPERYQFLVDVDRAYIGNAPLLLTGVASVRWLKPGSPVYAAERVRIRGQATTSLSHVNPGATGYEEYLQAQGVHSALQARGPDAVERVEKAPWASLAYWASRLRAAQAQRLERVVPASALPFVYAVWLGSRTTVSQDEYQAYIDSGTAHILSVSGVHMAMVFVTTGFLLRLFLRSVRWRAAAIMLVIMLFTLMSGVRPSALRSAIMVMMYLLADLFDRERDAPTALSLSALLLLSWNPDLLFDGGSQLSFVSVASILIFAEPVSSRMDAAALWLGETRVAKLLSEMGQKLKNRFPRKLRRTRRLTATTGGVALWLWWSLRGALAVSLAVQILPTPLSIHYFHVFPLFAFAANLLVVPLSTLVLWLSFAASVCVFLCPPAALLFGHALLPTVESIRKIAGLVAMPSVTHVTVTSPTAAALACYYGAALLFLMALRAQRRRPWLLGAAGLALWTLVLWQPFARQPRVVFLDVGHGDATFVRSPDGTTLLVDGGDSNNVVDSGQRTVAPFLWSNHVKRLDYVALSHPDRDHAGGLFYILHHFRVREFWLSAIPTDRPLERELLDLCARRGVAVRRLHAGEKVDMGGATVEVLHPPSDWPNAEVVNDLSLVLRVTWKGVRILLPGDVETAAETALSQTDCRADILKAPHHGSRTSSSEPFIEAVRPKHCIISTGGTSGREPADEGVLRRYAARGIHIWRTDLLGGIQLTPIGAGIRIESTRKLPGYLSSAEHRIDGA